MAIVTWMGFMHPLRRLDFWWHLKVGEIIFTSRSIPHTDLFSFTRAGQPFIYQNWLGEVFYYLVYRAGGLPLLVFFNTALLLMALVPVYDLCLKGNRRLRVAVLSSLVPAFVLGLYSNVRPQAYSFVFFAVFYWILWTYRDGERDRLWALPLLMLVWVNLHGAFVLGIGMMGIVLLAEVVRRLLRGAVEDSLPPRRLLKLAIILGLTAAATVVNPEGYRVFAYVRQLQIDPASQMFVTEWQVPDVKQMSDVLVFFGPFFVVVLTLLYARRRPNLTELGLFLTFSVLALAAVRSGIWFALIAAPILARHEVELHLPDLPARIGDWPFAQRLARRMEGRQERTPTAHPRLNWAILAWLALFTIALSPWVRPSLAVDRLNPQLVESSTPVGAMNYIADHALEGNIFHVQGYGDYLIWRLWPQQRSFIDGRVHLYDESFVQDYMLTFYDDDWESRIARYDIRYLLLPKDDSRAETMIKDARSSENWTLLYEDEHSVLFEKQGQ
ncbi:MAG: hypothetical protein ACE5F6_12100 [Anaerolineae bacterium]